MSLSNFQLLANTPAIFTKGWIVTIVGFLIVVFALFILSLIFRGVAAYFTRKDNKGDTAKEKAHKSVAKPAKEGEIPEEVLAAISMALYLSTNLHDEESNVLTIKSRETSWNHKSYGMRHWNH